MDAFQSVSEGFTAASAASARRTWPLGRVGAAPRPEAVEPRLLAQEVVQRGRRGEHEGLPHTVLPLKISSQKPHAEFVLLIYWYKVFGYF